MKLARNLRNDLSALTDYSEISKKFHIDYVISKIFYSLKQLHDLVNSMTDNLNLSLNNPFRNYVRVQLNSIY